jgi:hypothetical protein
MKIFITFGQCHIHKINDIIIDKDCVVAIEAKDHSEGRDKAFELFGGDFFTTREKIDSEFMKYFPRGVIDIQC